MRDAVDKNHVVVEGRRGEILMVTSLWQELLHFNLGVSDGLTEIYWRVTGWPEKLRIQCQHAMKMLNDEKQWIMQQIESESDFIATSLEAYHHEHVEIAQSCDLNVTASLEMALRLNSLNNRTAKLRTKITDVRNQQSLLQLPALISFDSVNKLKLQLDPLTAVWLAADDFHRQMDVWEQTVFCALEYTAIPSKLAAWTEILDLIASSISSSTPLHRVFIQFRRQLDAFSHRFFPALFLHSLICSRPGRLRLILMRDFARDISCLFQFQLIVSSFDS